MGYYKTICKDINDTEAAAAYADKLTTNKRRTKMRQCDKLAFQGDIALLAIGVLPKGCKKVTQNLNSAEREAYGYHPQKGLVLAQGESRNHFHAFREIDKVEMYETASNDNKRIFLVIKEEIPLVHEEHDPIKIAPNVYELFFQSEYTFEDEYRRVAD